MITKFSKAIAASLIFLGSLSANKAFSETLEGANSARLELQGKYKATQDYSVNVRKSWIPRKFLGNANGLPVEVSAKCGELILGKASRFYDKTMRDKVQELSFSGKFAAKDCMASGISLEFSSPGLSVETSNFFVDLIDAGENFDSFVERIRVEIPDRESDLIFYHGQMALSAENQNSLGCLIKNYEGRDLFKGIVQELKTEYQKVFGQEYNSSEVDCASRGDFAKEKAQCDADPRSRNAFCSHYRLYQESLLWFDDTFSDCVNLEDQLIESEQQKKEKLEKVIHELASATNNINKLDH